jgi:hypothetical protein
VNPDVLENVIEQMTGGLRIDNWWSGSKSSIKLYSGALISGFV